MKKLSIIGCAVLMVVLLMSFVGCPSPNSPDKPEFDPSVGTWITGETPDPYKLNNSIIVYVYVNKDYDTFTCLNFSYYERVGFHVQVDYKRADAFASETWFNRAKIDGSEILLNSTLFKQNRNTQFSVSINDFVSKSELLRLLPSSGDWVVHMISDKDATRNIHFEIPADKAEKVREWIMNQ